MGSKLSCVNRYGSQPDVANLPGWNNKNDPKPCKNRSTAVAGSIAKHSTKDLRTLIQSGWDVNGMLTMPDLCVTTALHEAVRQGWTERVKMLLDTGAECKTPDKSESLLMLALQNDECPPDLIKLLLKHGSDPNGHDSRSNNIPLLLAIANCRSNQHHSKIVQLLLEHGANPNVTTNKNGVHDCPLSAATDETFEVFSLLFKTLVQFGADVNYDVAGKLPLLHKIICLGGQDRFLREQLDLFFKHGGNINVEDGEHETALECAVRCANSKSIRWLIRHGADTSLMKVTLLKDYFGIHSSFPHSPETPLILLQAGMRVSHGALTQLRNLEMAISTWLQDDSEEHVDTSRHTQRLSLHVYVMASQSVYHGLIISERLHLNGPDRELDTIWDQLEAADEEELQWMQSNLRKSNLPEYQYLSKQMVDLAEFSDESLQVYPEDNYVNYPHTSQKLQYILDQIQKVLEFLSQTQSLQWYCRNCVRKNLVSLQPSVVKTLPIPPRLKRYILCHEI